MKRLWLLALLLLAACRTTAPPPPPATPTGTPPPAATPAPAAADPTAPPTATATVDPATLSPIFGTAWRDRSVYEADLFDGDRLQLDQLAAAPVYHLDLTLADDLRTLAGQQAVRYTNQERIALRDVAFHLYPNLLGGKSEIGRLHVNDSAAEPRYEQNDGVMRVPLSAPLLPNQSVVISFDLTVTVPITPDGYYGTFGAADGVLSMPHFYATVAAFDDDGWAVDEPAPQGDLLYADASFFQMRLTAPEAVTVITSGSALAVEQADGQQTMTIAAGPARDFYMAAGSDFIVLAREVDGTLVRAWAKSAEQDANARALDAAAAAIALFNERFGPYPYREFDVVSTSTQALGVEFPGIVMIADSLYAPDADAQSLTLESVVAHEAAHQWFYALVGNDQLNEPWLDESLTQYATWLFFREVYGTGGDQGFAQSLADRWSRIDNADIPIGLPVSAYEGREYSAIVYGRGPLFIDELAQRIGQETLDDVLRDYVAAYRWQIADSADFVQLAEQRCACDLSQPFAANVFGP